MLDTVRPAALVCRISHAITTPWTALKHAPLCDLVVHHRALLVLVEEIVQHDNGSLLRMCLEVLIIAQHGVFVIFSALSEGHLLQRRRSRLQDLGELTVQGLGEA